MKTLFIGTSGWSYKHWRNKFYPQNVAPKDFLKYYASKLDTVEINTGFYRLPSKNTFANWKQSVPEDFIFAVKASRYLTHLRKLNKPGEPWRRFYDNAQELGTKFGPVLFQFPANWPADVNRLQNFLNILPPTLEAAFEFRNPSWFTPPVIGALRQHNAAICWADSPAWPKTDIVTADFVFIRMHGGATLYGSRYSKTELKTLADNVKKLLVKSLKVYVYFNNDAEANAVANALDLREIIGRI